MKIKLTTALLSLSLVTTFAPTTCGLTKMEIVQLSNIIESISCVYGSFISSIAALKLWSSKQPIKLGRKSRAVLGIITASLAFHNALNVTLSNDIRAAVHLLFGIANTYLTLRLFTDPAPLKQIQEPKTTI